MKVVVNPMCTFCHNSNETFPHLFWKCQCTQSFWEKVHEQYTEFFMPECTLDWPKVWLNQIHDNITHLANLLILIAKQIICGKQKPSIKLFET